MASLPSYQQIKQAVLESPSGKTAFLVLGNLLVGVLSGTFVAEITIATHLEWSTFYLAKSFYGLLAVAWLIYWYNRASYQLDRDVRRFLDADYCVAYMRSKCLPEAADRFREMIRNGNSGQLEQAMEELRRSLK